MSQIDENSPFAYWEITNQSFWTNYEKQFSGEKLNERLLDNLSHITDKLHNEYHVSFATKLILRLIFIRYLIDRGVDLDYEEFSDDVKVLTVPDGCYFMLGDNAEESVDSRLWEYPFIHKTQVIAKVWK